MVVHFGVLLACETIYVSCVVGAAEWEDVDSSKRRNIYVTKAFLMLAALCTWVWMVTSMTTSTIAKLALGDWFVSLGLETWMHRRSKGR